MSKSRKITPVSIRSSAAEYLTYVSAVGSSEQSVEMRYENENVWLTQKMMAELYGVSVPAINQHIKNILEDGELTEDSVIKKYLITASDGKSYNTNHYNLQMIIAVGFKVNNERAVQFRKWANSVLKDYILKGYAVNESRLQQLGEAVRLMRRTQYALDSSQVLTVVESFSSALNLLDAYDHQNMQRPKGSASTYVLSYEECRDVIDHMRFGNESELFGKEKDDSFRGA